MKRLSLAAFVAIAACTQHPPEHEHAEGAPAHEDARAHADDDGGDRHEGDLLRIAPEMLRDLRVTTSPAEARSAGETVQTLGELHVNEDAYAEVGAPVDARIARVLAAPGDVVKKGQVLAELTSVELATARAGVSATLARHQAATQAHERKKALLAEKIVAEREVQEAAAEVAAAAAALEQARSLLRALGIADDDSSAGASSSIPLRAPIAGTVLERSAIFGAHVEPSATLFRIADVSKLWLVVHAFERDAVRVAKGAVARASFPSLPGHTFEGRVTLVGAVVDPTTRTIPVRVEVANADGALRPGMSGSAWLPLGDAGQQVVTVPRMAVQRVERDWAVFVPKGDGVFEPRRIGRGRDLAGEIEVLQGLRAGEPVVVDGAFLLKAEIEKRAGGGDEHEH